MKRLFTLLLLCLGMFSVARAQSIGELEKQLREAGSSKDKLSLNYQLAEAYLRSSAEKSIEYGKQAFNIARDLNNDGMTARSAFLVGKAYVRDRNDRYAKTWFDTALAAAKKAGDSDLIIKSVESRSKIEKDDRDYREAYQIVEEAFKYFSQNGTSISDLEEKYERQRVALLQEKKRLEQEINLLTDEREELVSDRSRLQQRQQELVRDKAIVEEKITEKDERLATISEAKERADSVVQTKEREVKSLTRERLEQEAVLKTKEALLAKASLEAEQNRRIAEQAAARQNQLLILATFGTLLALLLLVLFLIARRSRSRLAEKNKIIEVERQRSDELLLNILPKSIAEELKEFGKAKARKYEQVTVLFSDFKNFTSISEKLAP